MDPSDAQGKRSDVIQRTRHVSPQYVNLSMIRGRDGSMGKHLPSITMPLCAQRIVPGPDAGADAGTHVPSVSQTHAVGPYCSMVLVFMHEVRQVVPGRMLRSATAMDSRYADRYRLESRFGKVSH